MKKIHGFNLIEMMIVLIIISILSAICIPLYSEHLSHAYRLEAEINLVKLAGALETYYLLNNTYQNATLDELHFEKNIADNQYELAITSETENDFRVQAIPIHQQAERDTACGTLSLNSNGEKQISGGSPLTECWLTA
ncbi:MAG: hypothetical protein ACD_60C00143G0008 [uncultured bacterium]|nr:MAG: hypothetical protein ACD_60C00143G0008 [uncultured bacterium]